MSGNSISRRGSEERSVGQFQPVDGTIAAIAVDSVSRAHDLSSFVIPPGNADGTVWINLVNDGIEAIYYSFSPATSGHAVDETLVALAAGSITQVLGSPDKLPPKTAVPIFWYYRAFPSIAVKTATGSSVLRIVPSSYVGG